MRVDPSVTPRVGVPTTKATSVRTADPAGEAAGPVAATSTFTQTPELSRLLAGVRAVAEVRVAVVQAAAAQLAAGGFDGPEVAGQAAQAMIQAEG